MGYYTVKFLSNLFTLIPKALNNINQRFLSLNLSYFESFKYELWYSNIRFSISVVD